VELLHAATGSDWTGIYQVRDVDGEAALVKEAYRGRPSRAVFPCNPDFARTSNNATAVLTRRAILVRDVESHIAAGRPYYECDPEVRSELCLPVLRGRDPVGLIDLESFEANHFDFVKIALAIAVASSLVEHDLL
jgi:putative methionine-R-sulfoxide reductase with GAF domain